MNKHRFALIFAVFIAVFTLFSITASAEDKAITYISEDFEACPLTSYAGSAYLQASVKPDSGGSQNVVNRDTKMLNIAVDYISGASAHDSFVQMKESMNVNGDFVTAIDVIVPDSSKGVFSLYAICGEYIPLAVISNSVITYPDKSTDAYSHGEKVSFSVHINSQKNRLRIYKNGVLKFGTDDVKLYYPNCNLANIRIRFSANAVQGDTNRFEVYVDNFLATQGLSQMPHIAEKIYLAEDFESHEVTSYAGGNGIQASVKQSTGGSQNIVDGESRRLCMAVDYLSDASVHNSFIQMSEPIYVCGKFISSVDVNIPDSTKGSFNAELICGVSFIPFTVAKGRVTYPDGRSELCTDGETATFTIIANSITNSLAIYKNGVLGFKTDNINNLYPGCDLSRIRERYSVTAYSGDGNTFKAYIDNIYIAGGNAESDLYIKNGNISKEISGTKYKVTKLRNSSYELEIPVGYSGESGKKLTFIVAHYSRQNSDDGKCLSDVDFTDVNLTPGFSRAKIKFDIDKYNTDDICEVYLMPEGDYIMMFQRIKDYRFTQITNPTGEEMVNLLSDAHPRIWLSEDKINELRSLIQTDEIVKSWYQSLKADAAKLLTDPLPVYEDDDPQRLVCSQKVVASVPLLSFMYHLDGNEEYAYRAYEYMIAVCEFEDWAPYHFLDTSNVTTAVAIGYDWLYNYFVSRNINLEYFEDKIAFMGLSMAKDAYRKKLYTGNHWWVDATTNWNVCCNSGMTVGALAIGNIERYSQLSAFVLEAALESLERMLPRFAPDGAWFEGPSYWHSTTAPLTNIAYALQTALGSDYGIMNFEGISNTAYYPIINTGRAIAFNLHDASESSVDAPQYWYFASIYGDKNIAGYRHWQLTQKGCKPTYKDILWYDKALIEEDFDRYIKKDDYFRDIEVAVFRNTYKGNNINFFGIHGGSNSVEHGQLDAGSFVYEALGERWAVDLGGEAYNMHNYWIMDDIEKSRWGYYRSRAEGHNTIVINPASLADQDLDCVAKITDFSSTDTQGTATVDISGAYKKHASSAIRSAMFDKTSGKLEISDNIKLNGTGNVYWFMHTKAEITLSDDGRVAYLTQNGKSVSVSSKGVGTFSVMDAVPLPTSPNPDLWPENIANDGSSRAPTHQNKNSGVKKLVIFLEDATGEVNFNVEMNPLN